MHRRNNRVKKIKSKIRRYQLYTKAMSMLLTLVILFLAIPVNIYAEIAEAIPESKGEVINPADEESQAAVQREIYEDISLREINTKHFRLPDGSYVAAQYAYPVHYVAEDGSLVDINNALSDVGGGMYANESARVKFSKKINGSAALFELKDGSTKLTLSLIGANKGTGGIVTNGTDDEEDTELQKMMNLEALSSTVLYPDALDGVDLEYIVSSLSIKENIIVKEQKESYSYSFELKLNGLTAELSESGDILIYDTDTAKYVIPSPVVYDASGAYAPEEASAYTLTGKGNGKYTLTVSVSAEWMNDGARVFPVTVDPTIDSAEYGLDIEYAVTNSASPDNALPDPDYITLSASQTGYLKISQLPSIPGNALVTEAKLNLYAQAFVPYVSIGAHFATSSWNETLTYNGYVAGAGSYDVSYLDVVDIEESSYIELDISAAASRWYGSGEDNNGISITFVSDTNIAGQNLICILSPTAEENAPEFTINYRIIDGVEGYWPTISQSAGLAGVGTVNLATGALNFSIPLMSTTAPLMTFTPTLVYNSSMAGKLYGAQESYTSYTDARAPFGMMLNMSETVKVISYGENNAYTMMLYVDGDGTPHYFYPNGNSNTYRDEDGLGLKLWIYGNNLRIQDRNNNIRIFSRMGSDTSWYLSRIEDSNSNAIVFAVDHLYRVIKIGVDPYGEIPFTIMLFLEYNSNGLPSRIYNPATYESFVFRYSGTYNGNIASNSGAYLRQIDFAQGTSSTTTQNWANFVSSQASRTNITLNGGVDYRYDSNGTLLGAMERSSLRAIRYIYDTSKRVIRVFENGTLEIMAPGNLLAMSYGLGYTDVRSPGSDDISNNDDDVITRYVFDSQGRATSIYSMAADGGEIYGATFGEYSSGESSKNSLSQRSVLGGSSVNYIRNGGFEKGTGTTADYWSSSGTVSRTNISANMGAGRKMIDMRAEEGQTAQLYQDVYLWSGEYTLSFPFVTQRCDGAEIKAVVSGLNDVSYTHTDYLDLNPTTSNGVYSFFQTTFEVEVSGYYRISVMLYGAGTTDSRSLLKIDNVMLERATGSSDYNWVEDGGFEITGRDQGYDGWRTGAYSSYINTYSSSDPFNYTLKINANTTVSYARQRIYQATESELTSLSYNHPAVSLIISGYANAPDAMLSGNAPFRLRVEVSYYQGIIVDSNGNSSTGHVVEDYYIDFLPGVSGWQFASGSITLYDHERMEPDFIYDTIEYIDVYCEYLNQPNGYALFDNISVIEDTGRSTYYAYTDSGKVAISRTGYYEQYMIYDDLDRLVRVADTKGDVIDYTYLATTDLLASVITSTVVNNLGYRYSDYAVLVEDESTGATPVPLKHINKTKYLHNVYGLVTSSELTAYRTDNTVNTDYPGYRTEYTYELTSGSKIFGALLREYNYSGSDIRYFYDSASGYLLAEVNITSGNGYAYTYDALGRMTKAVPARSTDGESFTLPTTNAAVEYTYDTRGDLSEISTYTTEYLFDYDEFGNVLSISIGTDEIVSYDYNDFNGKLIKTTYANGLSEEYSYNDIDLLTEIWYTEGEEKTLAFSYEYTASGMIHKISDHINETSTVYNYDSRDRLINFSTYDRDTDTHDYSSEIYYDNNDQVSGWYGDIQYGSLNGYTESIQYQYSYNDDGTVKRVKYSSGNDITATVNYSSDNYYRNLGATTTYYAYGDRFSLYTHYTYDTNTVANQEYATSYITGYESRVNGVSRNEIYSYNNAGYISYSSSSENGTCGIYYWYDSLGQLIRVDDQVNNMSTEYVYDDSGNLLYYTDAEYSQDELTNIFGATQFEYTDSEWGDLLTSYNGHSITYDALGNPLSYYNTRAYTFTWSGREMRSATVGGKTYSFTYDESGMRHTKTVSGATTTYYYNGSLLVAERNSSEIIIYIYDANGLPIGMQYHANTYAEDEWDVYWFERSMLGDIIAVYASDGTKLIGYRYDAWGVFWVSYYNGGQNTSATKNSFGYRGYYYDKDLRMYYLASRYYDTRIMRFISADGFISTGQGILGNNMYAYCGNNPVNRVDYSGHSWSGILEFARTAIAEIGAAIVGVSPAYAGCAGAALVDGPIPIGDVIAVAGVVLITACAVGYGIYKAYNKKSNALSTNESSQVITSTPQSDTVIYRYGGTNPGNLTPSQRDVNLYEVTGKGLSFSTVPKPGAAMTTMEALNSTGAVYAVYDGAGHVSVHPIGGTLEDWHNAGSSSVWTTAVKSVVIKWDGTN